MKVITFNNGMTTVYPASGCANVDIFADDTRLRLNTTPPVEYTVLTPEQAEDLAAALIEAARMAREAGKA